MYVAPEIVEIGTVRDITLGGKDGADLDASPTRTAKGRPAFQGHLR